MENEYSNGGTRNNIVVVRIFNGVGNQLFQYAVGRCLAKKAGVDLRLDVSSYEWSEHRKYQLDEFCINAKRTTQEDLNGIFGRRSGPLYQSLLFRLLEKVRPLRYRRLFEEKNILYDKNLWQVRPPVYLNGYWQCEKYFRECADIIASDFRFKNKIKREIEEKHTIIRGAHSVCLHVRRGDYAEDVTLRDIHGVCDRDYYRRAISIVRKKIPLAKFYLFTDDINWASKNIASSEPDITVASAEEQTNLEDFYLMRGCKHFVISNSSFGWWAAWLAKEQGSVIVAPKLWFATKERDGRDIVPKEWLTL